MSEIANLKNIAKTIEKYLSLGHPPTGVKITNVIGAVLMASRELKIPETTLRPAVLSCTFP